MDMNKSNNKKNYLYKRSAEKKTILAKCSFLNNRFKIHVLQPCAVKIARTVVRGGKLVKVYLSRLDQQVYFSSELNCF